MKTKTHKVDGRKRSKLGCKKSQFFLKISKEIGKAWRKSLTRAKCASLTRSLQTCLLTARAYLNTQKYGLFCSLGQNRIKMKTMTSYVPLGS